MTLRWRCGLELTLTAELILWHRQDSRFGSRRANNKTIFGISLLFCRRQSFYSTVEKGEVILKAGPFLEPLILDSTLTFSLTFSFNINNHHPRSVSSYQESSAFSVIWYVFFPQPSKNKNKKVHTMRLTQSLIAASGFFAVANAWQNGWNDTKHETTVTVTTDILTSKQNSTSRV